MEHVDLLALADFTLVARHGGFGRAARAAGRPKATLSRRVAELEGALAVRLFERGGRALRLTEEGRALHERASVLLADLDETAAAIAAGSAQPRGRLRISAPLLFAQTALGKLAASFAVRHPAVRLEVSTEDRAVDMVEEGFDLVIRVNPAPDAALVGRVFLRDRLVVVASPTLARPRRDHAAPAIVRSFDEPRTWNVRTRRGPATLAVEPVLALASLVMIRDAVHAGVGAARLPLSLVAREIDAGRLVCWGDVEGPEVMLWALYPSRRLLGARVAAFLEHLTQAFPSGSPEELAALIGA